MIHNVAQALHVDPRKGKFLDKDPITDHLFGFSDQVLSGFTFQFGSAL